MQGVYGCVSERSNCGAHKTHMENIRMVASKSLLSSLLVRTFSCEDTFFIFMLQVRIRLADANYLSTSKYNVS